MAQQHIFPQPSVTTPCMTHCNQSWCRNPFMYPLNGYYMTVRQYYVQYSHDTIPIVVLTEVAAAIARVDQWSSLASYKC